jgi:hypothetical protein
MDEVRGIKQPHLVVAGGWKQGKEGGHAAGRDREDQKGGICGTGPNMEDGYRIAGTKV